MWVSFWRDDLMIRFWHSRFEYLWPFWLLLRSLYDSYKYKGLVTICSVSHAAPIDSHLLLVLGLFISFHLHRHHQWFSLLIFYSRSVDLLRGVDLRVDSVCMDTHRKGHLSAHHYSLASVRMDGSENSMERQPKHATFGSVSTLCRTLHRLSRCYIRIRLQKLHRI